MNDKAIPERGREAVDEKDPPHAADTASPMHGEWLLDEALQETFPASDPIRPAQRDGAKPAPGRASSGKRK